MPRLTCFALITCVLLFSIALLSPQQLNVVLYKVCLVTLGGVVGYWLDRSLFPYARPHDFIQKSLLFNAIQNTTWLACGSMIRRGIVIFACILGITMGL